MLVRYTQPNVLTAIGNKSGETFQFVPGTNEVPQKLWNELLGNPNFARRVKDGVLKVVSEEDTAEGGSPLVDLGPADAKAMVRETYDPELLRSWRAQETRKTVLAVIDEQLAIPEERMAERKRQAKQQDDEDEE